MQSDVQATVGSPHDIQATAQTLAQVVERFKSQGQAQGVGGALERSAGEQSDQESAQERGGHGVAWKRVGQENGEGMAATGAMAAIGAKHALAAERLPGGVGGIVAVQEAVPVQEADTVAALAALLFEGKSWWFNASQSRTKRNGVWGMGGVAAKKAINPRGSGRQRPPAGVARANAHTLTRLPRPTRHQL
jgi:hypothetical protein